MAEDATAWVRAWLEIPDYSIGQVVCVSTRFYFGQVFLAVAFWIRRIIRLPACFHFVQAGPAVASSEFDIYPVSTTNCGENVSLEQMKIGLANSNIDQISVY